MTSKEKELGQYITPTEVVDFMISLITHSKSSRILEPAAGNGVFVRRLKQLGYANVDAFEIDPKLANARTDIQVANFLALDLEDEYDVVIGNPPYVRWKYLDENLKHFLMTSNYWKETFNRLSDLSFAFIHSAVRALRDGGELIFISPLFWQNAHHGKWLRRHLLKNGHLELLVDLGEMRIFSNATLHFIIFRYRKNSVLLRNKVAKKKVLVCKVRGERIAFHEISAYLQEIMNSQGSVSKRTRDDVNDANEVVRHLEVFQAPHPEDANPWIFLNSHQVAFTTILERSCNQSITNHSSPQKALDRQVTSNPNPIRLQHVAIIANGLVSGMDKAFRLPDDKLSALNEFERQHLLKVAKARDLEQYRPARYRYYLFVNDILEETEFRLKAPHFHQQLLPYKSKLLQRYSYGKKLPWWHWAFLRSMNVFNRPVPKIFVPCKERINHRQHVRFALVPPDVYPTQDITVILPQDDVKEDIRFILAQLNSSIWFRWLQAKGHVRGGVLEFSEKPLERIPIRLINWQSSKERDIHEEIVILVQYMIDHGFSREKQEAIDDLLVELLGLSHDGFDDILKNA